MPSALADGDRAVRSLEVTEGAAALLAVLFPHLAGLEVSGVADAGDAVVVFASVRGALARCPRCGQQSSRVHGRYQRLLADGAAGGRPLLIALSVRRFRCANPGCRAVTFAEQAEGLCARYLRRTLPLREMLGCFGLELAGRAGARLAAAVGIAVHSSTLLRLVMALPDPVVTAAPQVTGVDDFALRKGQVYGTVVADAESGKVIDLLPDREAATLEQWLKARPGAEVICRDRASAYSDGASAGAPLAVQVADRWHLWHNLGEYAEKAVAAHRGCLAGAPDAGTTDSAPSGQAPAAPPPEPDGLRDVCGRERALVSRTLERHAAVRELLREGRSQREAAGILGLDRKTVGRFAAEAGPGRLLVKATGRAGKLDPFKPWINRRWNEGLTNAAALHAEITAQGWTGSVQAVERYVRQFRAADGRSRAGRNPRQAPAAAAPPKTRQVTRWLLTHPDHLDPASQARFNAARAQCPHLDARRPRPRLRQDHDPPPGPARTRRLARPSRGQRPASAPLLRPRHPPRPAGRHRRPLPALELRRHGRQRQQDQNDQAANVRPRRIPAPAQTRHPPPCVTTSQNSRKSPIS
jgi:transposase